MDRQIAQLISNGLNSLGRKIDSLAMELRNKRTPNSQMNIGIPENVSEGISNAIEKGMSKLEIPQPKINIPEQKAPIVNVPAPIVNVPAPIVNIPKIEIPTPKITVTPTPVTFPDKMEVVGMKDLIASVNRETDDKSIFEEVSSKKPLCVQIMDSKGKQITQFGGEFTAPSMVAIRVGSTPVGEDNPIPVTVDGFAIPMFDTQIIDEADPNNVTIIYKRNGVTVATKLSAISGTTTTISVT